MLDVNQIKEFLPHRYPFLLVDRIVEVEPGRRVVGIKNITVDDLYTMENFNVLSGALQIEIMAQVAGFAVKDLLEDTVDAPFFASIDQARFRKTAVPGDQLRVEVTVKKFKGKVAKFDAVIHINGAIASEATLTCLLGQKF
jgi:3-hydroxyacyl-[acyl-carrier-protein] dehydratase